MLKRSSGVLGIVLMQYNKSSEKSFIFGDGRFGIFNCLHKNLFSIPKVIKFSAFKSVKLGLTFGAGLNEMNNLIIWGQTIDPFNSQIEKLDIKKVASIECNVAHQLTHLSFTKITIGQNSILGITNNTLCLIDLNGNYSFIDVPNNEKIIKIDSGDHHACIMTNKSVYTYPMNAFNKNYQQCEDKLVKLDIDAPLDIACGSDHSLIACSKGLYAMGCNIDGQCGLLPSKVAQLSKIDAPLPFRVFSGGNTSYIVSNGAVYSCGNRQYGQLGNGRFTKSAFKWQKINKISNLSQYSERENKLVPLDVKDIICGKYHTIVELDSDKNYINDTFYGNDILGFGLNKFGQVGNGKKGLVAIPSRIIQQKTDKGKTCLKIFTTPKQSQKIACGLNTTLIYTQLYADNNTNN